MQRYISQNEYLPETTGQLRQPHLASSGKQQNKHPLHLSMPGNYYF